jgi:outer membrane protein assembly factor BamB
VRRVIVAVSFLLLASACAADNPLPRVELASVADADAECQWPTFGGTSERSFQSCNTSITTDNVDELRPIWFFNTDDAVSGSPVVVEGSLFVGDWAGVVYSLDAETGAEQWRQQMALNPRQYGGQISGSVAYSTERSEPAVIVAAGDTVYALDPTDGRERWAHRVTNDDFGEVLGSPLLAGNAVIVGFDAHGAPLRSGVLALDIESGAELWYFDPEKGQRNGCGGVWGTPTLDPERELVFFGTANCPTAREGWNEFSEALIAIDANTGDAVWSFQPHDEKNDRDADFAGAPNLFTTSSGRALVGLGNKDATYYAVDRDTGEIVWSTTATEDGFIRPNFASGGFIGPAAVGDGVIVGATAVGQCPCLHAIDADTGAIRWQQLAVEPSFAPTTIVGDLAFVASIDTLLRAVDLETGDMRWSHPLGALASGGIAAVGDDVWAVAGFREPGSAGPSASSGVFRFSVDPDAVVTFVPPEATPTAPTAGEPVRLVDASGDCVDQPCSLTFGIKDPPVGTAPELTMTLQADPFEISVTSSGLGDPSAWIREGSDAAVVGATAFGVMISERDDDPNGGFLCVLDEAGTCTGTTVPNPGASYNRISVLAIASADTVPEAGDGFSRLVDTIAFSPPLQTALLDVDPDAGHVVFSGQGNDLVAYTLDGRQQLLIQNANDDPDNGRDINAQVCFLDDHTFIAGEDTGQPDLPPGWGIFSLSGDRIGEFHAEQIGKLIPTYQPADSQPEMFGCGVLSGGRVVLTDVGNQATGDATGQLMMFFPPDSDAGAASYVGEITDHCKIDIAIATAQQIAVDGDTVLVAAARGPGVSRYTNLPTSLDECDLPTTRELFINPADGALGITSGIAPSPNGGWYVSSVFTGVINEYNADGQFVREILRPPEGETFGSEPFSTGTPNGLTVTADGTLWYADLAIVLHDSGSIGPGNAIGTVRVIRFVDGDPQPPEVIDDGLRFPDALSVIP